ncbi:MAG: hypothetical protein A4E61_00131 [Syntrophorhabdus sp. PtaB.Bin184]|nr:MAG: hypothetical protein A4E61_00131 [Syntrophorhabdus sp. PtaB.Bin184]
MSGAKSLSSLSLLPRMRPAGTARIKAEKSAARRRRRLASTWTQKAVVIISSKPRVNTRKGSGRILLPSMRERAYHAK